MRDLIEALTIFAKYKNADWKYPTWCEHDELFVLVDPVLVSPEDRQRLLDLGFHADDNEGHFCSYRYGSA